MIPLQKMKNDGKDLNKFKRKNKINRNIESSKALVHLKINLTKK